MVITEHRPRDVELIHTIPAKTLRSSVHNQTNYQWSVKSFNGVSNDNCGIYSAIYNGNHGGRIINNDTEVGFLHYAFRFKETDQ